MPHVVNHLSNYINMLQEGKKTVMLNANAPTFVHEAKVKAADNKTSTAEKERSRNVSEKVDKDIVQVHNNDKSNNVKENEWKRTPTTKCMQKSSNKKCDKIEEKGCDHNRFSRSQEIIDEVNETQEAISEAKK